MYRLYNFGIERKIDWLVKNRKLEGKKIIISPWTEECIAMYQYLTQKWGVDQEIIRIDGEVSPYHRGVCGMDALDTLPLDGSYVALLISWDKTVANRLEEKGVPFENIYFIKGDELKEQDALIRCLEDEAIHTVLDVGCGTGNHSRIFLEHGKQVTGVDLWADCRIKEDGFQFIKEDFIGHAFSETYDLVWTSHVLEHQMAVGAFIQKLFLCCKENGQVAITVPYETGGRVVEGHVSFWNAGLLMYNIIQSGFSCKRAAVKTYANNVSVIVPKEPIFKDGAQGVIADSRPYFPERMQCGNNRYGGVLFDGNIKELNWKR